MSMSPEPPERLAEILLEILALSDSTRTSQSEYSRTTNECPALLDVLTMVRGREEMKVLNELLGDLDAQVRLRGRRPDIRDINRLC